MSDQMAGPYALENAADEIVSWRATVLLRWARLANGQDTLQQQWEEQLTGEVEWWDVPIEGVEESER